MKKVIFISSFIICFSLFSFGQEKKSELVLQINQINFNNLKEVVETDDVPLFTSPTENDVTNNFGFNINYITSIKKLPFIFQFGYSQIDQMGSLNRVIDTFLIENIDTKTQNSFILGVGLSPSTKLGDTNFGVRGIGSVQVGYNNGGDRNFYSYVYTKDNIFIEGDERLIAFENSFRLGINIEASIFYTINKRFSVGVGVRNIIYYNFQNGNTVEIRNRLGESREMTNQILINHFENEKRLIKGASLSVNLSYNFK